MLCRQIKKNQLSTRTELSRQRSLFAVPRPRLEAPQMDMWKGHYYTNNEDISHVSFTLYNHDALLHLSSQHASVISFR